MQQSKVVRSDMQRRIFGVYTCTSYRFLVKVDKKFGIQPEYLAPLTDAGVTPYRAIKKVKNLLGPGKSIGILEIGGLGSYGRHGQKI